MTNKKPVKLGTMTKEEAERIMQSQPSDGKPDPEAGNDCPAYKELKNEIKALWKELAAALAVLQRLADEVDWHWRNHA